MSLSKELNDILEKKENLALRRGYLKCINDIAKFIEENENYTRIELLQKIRELLKNV